MAKIKKRTHVVICDAGPLIHLDELGSIELLGEFDEVLIPQAVWEEVELHRSTAFKCASVAFKCIDLRGHADHVVQSLAMTFSLHKGEIEALRLARRENAAFFFTDDTAARFAARAMGLKVHGTLGILIRSIRHKQKSRTEVLALLRSIPKHSSLFISQKLLSEVINQVENEH